MKGTLRDVRFRVLWISLLAAAGAWGQPSGPALTKAFGAATIPLNGTTSLTFTITVGNDDGGAYSGIGFTDTLPAGLAIATPNGLTGSCGGGTITAAAGAGSLSLAGATLPADGSCTFSMNVTGTTAGVKNNTTSTVSGTVWDEATVGDAASASVTVVAPPSIGKSFGAAGIGVGGSTSLSFTISNSNASLALSGVGFTDTLPAGVTVATPNGLTGSCGGGTITAAAGSGSVSLTGATVAASGVCTFSVNVTGTTSGTKNNTTGAVTSTEGGTGNAASASVTVSTAPTISKSFGTANLQLGAGTTLSFTITNPNSGTPLTGVGFTDTLPAGVTVATPNGLTGSCGGGAITASAGSGSVSLAGASLAASGVCTFSVGVRATTTGTKNNTTGAVISNEAGAGNTASATVTVQAAQTVGVPAVSATALGGLALLLAGLGWLFARRAQTQG